jgi:hypothetical protein
MQMRFSGAVVALVSVLFCLFGVMCDNGCCHDSRRGCRRQKPAFMSVTGNQVVQATALLAVVGTVVPDAAPAPAPAASAPPAECLTEALLPASERELGKVFVDATRAKM